MNLLPQCQQNLRNGPAVFRAPVPDAEFGSFVTLDTAVVLEWYVVRDAIT